MKSTVPLTLRWTGGGGGGVDTPNRFFQFFSGMGRAFISNKIFSCSLILGTSFHQTIFQIEPTVLALKLDKERVLRRWFHPLEFFVSYFSNHEDKIQS